MKRVSLVATGVLSVAPFMAFGLLIFSFFVLSDSELLGTESGELSRAVIMVFLATIPLLVATVIYYLFLVFKSDLPESKKILWTIVLLIWFPFTLVAFWYVRIWKTYRFGEFRTEDLESGVRS